MNFLRDERGSALVEFAGFLSLLVFILVGVIDYAAETQQAMQVQEAAAVGANFGAMPGNVANLIGMQAAATNAALGVHGFSVTAANLWTCAPGGTSIARTATCSGGGTPYEYVVVTTSATVPPMMSYVGIPASTVLHGSATYRVPWS
jgi:Flp pilus assembly protein TadG